MSTAGIQTPSLPSGALGIDEDDGGQLRPCNPCNPATSFQHQNAPPWVELFMLDAMTGGAGWEAAASARRSCEVQMPFTSSTARVFCTDHVLRHAF